MAMCFFLFLVFRHSETSKALLLLCFWSLMRFKNWISGFWDCPKNSGTQESKISLLTLIKFNKEFIRPQAARNPGFCYQF